VEAGWWSEADVASISQSKKVYQSHLDPGTAAIGSQTAKTGKLSAPNLLISEAAAAAADRITVCSGLMILDSEQNINLSKIIYLP